MRQVRFQFRLRTLMVVVLLAALVSGYEVEREYVAAWQKATMTVEVQFEVDNDGDGRADEAWTQYGDKRWEKVNVIWNLHTQSKHSRARGPRPLKILTAPKETCAMSAKRISIRQVMMVIALAAVNLAVTRAALGVDIFPQNLVVLLGSIDFLVIWKLILNRSLRAFHYTFLIVFVVSFIVMAHEVSMDRFHPLGVLVRWYQHVTGEKTTSISLGFPYSGEFWMACLLSFTLGCAIGLVAAWLEERRGWDIAAFLRGALIGLAIASLLQTVAHAAWGGAEPLSVLWIGRVVSVACLVLGGFLGLSRLKSRRPGREDSNG